jgi:benzoate/toluate 1,2-dioxygenase alpha subunit
VPSGIDVERLIDHRPREGVFRVHRDAFRSEAVFELEMQRIFEGSWIYVGHASQLPRPHDYLTAWVGRRPVVVMRDAGGALGCFINSCRHRGAQVCHHARGHAKAHVCRYHGWTYDSAGRNVAIKARAQGAYPAAFDAESHDLARVPRFGEYRGFLFASLAEDVAPLEEHLGDARVFVDLVVDQSAQGIELLPGEVRYTYRANWKLQLENTLDAYHLTSVHPSYFRLLDRRAVAAPRADVAPALWQGGTGLEMETEMGSFGFEQGHALVWTRTPVERHPLHGRFAEIERRVGTRHADWMLRTRQFCLFPNLQLGSSAALQMRVIRPLAPDLTEMTTYCIAPAGESPEARRQRLRQYEDFYNPSGLATPDDTVTYEDCQQGFRSGEIEWQQGYVRGTQAMRAGADEHAAELGIRPATSMHGAFDTADETVFQAVYLAWQRLLARGAAR